MPIRRDDFREVQPTAVEVAAWIAMHPNRAEHIPCGTRMWYSGIGIGAHLKSCRK